MAVFHIILRNLAFIDLHLLGEVFGGEGLLKSGISLVLFVCKNAFHGADLPGLLTARGWNVIIHQVPRNIALRLTLHKHSVYEPYDFRFLGDDLGKTVCALSVAEELLVRKADLTVRKLLALAPGDVLGDGTAFLLRQGGHNRQEQFSLGVECPYVLLFKEDLNAFFLKLSYGGQAVHGVSCKTADRLGNDKVYLARNGICDHLIEALSLLGVRAGDAFIGINLYELPFGVVLDILCVVIDLCLVGGELLVAVGGHTGIACHPSSSPCLGGFSCELAYGCRDNGYVLGCHSILLYLFAVRASVFCRTASFSVSGMTHRKKADPV